MTLTQLDRLQVKANFSETDAARLRLGDPSAVSVDALPGSSVPATLAAIDPLESMRGGVVSYEVTFVLDDDRAGLRPGMTAEALAEVDRADRTLVVPRTAVRSPLGTNPSVMVVRPDGRQELRIVATGLQNGREVQILAGVGLGERVLGDLAPPPEPGVLQ